MRGRVLLTADVHGMHAQATACTECPIKRSRRYQTMVYFTMIKDVLHIMFTLVRKRKDSSF